MLRTAMWLYDFAAVILAAIAVSLWWKRRLALAEEELVRARAESASLRDQQHQLRGEARVRELAVLNSMDEGVLLLDADGCVRLSNQAMNAMFGVSYDIRGQTLLEAFRLEGLQEVLRRVLVEGQLLNYELDLPGEERRFIQINANTLLDRESRREGIILECRDLTRVRQLENTRRDFVANVSHELRTPLSLIKGYAETLQHSAKDDPTVAERFLRTIEKHADRLTYLIEDLLTLSRLESGQIVMNTQTVELLGAVDEVLADLEPRLKEKQVTVVNGVKAGLSVRVDADRLQQVLSNLVHNAVKYGKQAGRVRLDANRAANDRVEVRVSDDGPGIPPAALQRIFERFYRADKARSREQGGTGLGLAIVKHIVQFHGGEVWAESAPGQGTTFFFTLPAAADHGE